MKVPTPKHTLRITIETENPTHRLARHRRNATAHSRSGIGGVEERMARTGAGGEHPACRRSGQRSTGSRRHRHHCRRQAARYILPAHSCANCPPTVLMHLGIVGRHLTAMVKMIEARTQHRQDMVRPANQQPPPAAPTTANIHSSKVRCSLAMFTCRHLHTHTGQDRSATGTTNHQAHLCASQQSATSQTPLCYAKSPSQQRWLKEVLHKQGMYN